MIDQTKNFMIGIFVVAAISLIVFIILFIHPTVGNEGRMLRVRFSNIDKVNIGTRVTFGGKPVGEVVEIREVSDPQDPRHPVDGVIYIYELTLAIDSGVNVYTTDEISLRTSGLLGDKSVNITPLPPKKGEILRLITGKDVLYAHEGGSVEDTLKEFRQLSDKVEVALDGFIGFFENVKESGLIANFSDTFGNLKNITGALDEPTKWNDILTHVDDVTKGAANSWPTVDNTIKNLSQTVDNAKLISDNGIEIAQTMREGRGTLGKIVMKDDLYLQLSSILSKGETAFNDINHYGVFFHLDKNWQRLRARRVNLLQKLSSPREFRNFFNDEIDQISTALGRVNMILEETGTCDWKSCLIYNEEFSKVFAELLRRTEEIEENLKLYNIQLNDCRVKETEFYETCSYCQ